MTDGSTIDSAAELKPIRIFVGSPGDMIAERQAALRVIEAVNRAAQGTARLSRQAAFLRELIEQLEAELSSYRLNTPALE
jgi:predicted ATP-grasp superfamily ATP-dependent carboligase